MKTSLTYAVVIMAVLPILASCSIYKGYPGASRHKGAIAILQVSNIETVQEIDDQEVDIKGPAKLGLAPGQHHLRIQRFFDMDALRRTNFEAFYMIQNYTKVFRVNFNAEAGSNYIFVLGENEVPTIIPQNSR